jgi:protein-S-isoprenylcysteine O-methyltransferase Ste14
VHPGRAVTKVFWQALFAFLVLPGTIGFAIPLLLIAPPPSRSAFSLVGLFALIPGIVILLWCVREFYYAGKGTLAPWTPPKSLVTTGLYRFSRNPMYVGVSLILLGWAIGYQSRALALYFLTVAILFHVRVIWAEEPFLASTHGDAWTHYKGRVPRWLGRPDNSHR